MADEAKEGELTDKQIAFCEKYVRHWNGTKAALEAGYSEKTAKQIATENLSKPYLQQYIAALKSKTMELAGISPVVIAETLSSIVSDFEAKNSDRIKAMETLNRMGGWNAPEKKEVNLKGAIIDWTE